jgi:hypothetical protein
LERPRLSEEEFLRLGADALAVDFENLRGRGRSDTTVRALEMLVALGAERWGLQVKAMAGVLEKHPVTASGWVMRGIERRQSDPEFQTRFEKLDRALAQG